MWWECLGRGVEDPSVDACISIGVACACPSALTEIPLSSLLSTILRPMDRAPRGNSGAGMLVRVEMGRVGDELSRCGPSFICSAGLMGALR